MTKIWKWKALGVVCGLAIGVFGLGTVSHAVGRASHEAPATASTVATDNIAFGALREDCGPDKGKCSGDGHCCRIGGSGWCCAKDKTCGEEIGDCK